MNILLLGANGQLGQTFLHDGRLAEMGASIAATRDGQLLDGTRCETVDLASAESLHALLEKIQPDVIVNAAAYNAVDRAEDEKALARRINTEAVAEIGAWAARAGSLVVHYSSDYVFDGHGTSPYKPSDGTNPLSIYGESKRDGELAIAQSGARHLVFRTSWVYSPFGSNFLKTMLRLGEEKDELSIVVDQRGTPTSSDIIVEGTMRALEREVAQGEVAVLEHLVASDATTWFDFAGSIFMAARDAGLIERMPRLMPVGSDTMARPARRPQFSVLDNQGFKQRYGYDLPHWRHGVSRVIDSLKASG